MYSNIDVMIRDNGKTLVDSWIHIIYPRSYLIQADSTDQKV